MMRRSSALETAAFMIWARVVDAMRVTPELAAAVWADLPTETKQRFRLAANAAIISVDWMAPQPMTTAPGSAAGYVAIWTVKAVWVRARYDDDERAWVTDQGHRLAAFDAVCWRWDHQAPDPEFLHVVVEERR